MASLWTPRDSNSKMLPFIVCSVLAAFLMENSNALTCRERGTPVAPSSLPIPPDSYLVDVEVNIMDKGYTAQARVYYSYYSNAATIITLSQGESNRYIFSYATDEIFTISGADCVVSQLTASHDIYSTWLLGSYRMGDGQLHVKPPQWFTNFTYGTDYGPNYIENTTVRGVPVDHWQTCGKWQPDKSILVDYYLSKNWTSATTYPQVPVRIEVMADRKLANGSLYSLHHFYDFFNFITGGIESQKVFQTPVGVICPGRKNTKKLPKLPERFYVRNEIIYESLSLVTYEDVWYDDAFKYYRRDYRPLTAVYPTFSYDPLTEVHDYYIGARYVIDKGQGNCTTLPLSNSSNDVKAEHFNGSYAIHLRNAFQLFNLDWNYTYIGQVMERGVLCDVYVTRRNNLLTFDMPANSNTTITFYFLAPEWDSYDNTVIQAADYGTPVKMTLQDDVGLSVTYNYVDFSLTPMLETYDISTCYPEAHELQIQVRFQGVPQQQQTTIPFLKNAAHMTFAEQMGVAYLRIQHLTVDYDDAYTYISATLLDKTPSTAQFEYIPGKVIEKQDDSIIYKIYTPFQCARLCIDNQAFICNSFDFCTNDQSCRLSRGHIGDGKAVVTSSATCDHFSRSVNGVHQEPSIEEAFAQLRMKIYNRTLSLPINMGLHMTAVDVSVKFGWLTTDVKMPTLPESFHYKIEGTIPALKRAYEGEVWYDKTFQLIRYDTHFNGPVTPYHSTSPLTIIDDFSTGLQYVVDRVNMNCTIQAIPRTDFGGILTPQGQHNSTWSLRMKTQYELLHIDNSYKFVGQQTVRGMLCNVFEALRTDFRAPGVEGNYQSVFKYFFLAKDWYEVSEEFGGAQSEPVRVEITIVQFDTFIEYNIYDFNSDRPDVSIYDIHQCFNATSQQTFQITFQGPYHPYLDTKVGMFKDEVIFAMARISMLPPLRFQRTRIDYDNTNIYVTTTMVGNAMVPHYFTYIINGSVVQHTDKVVSSQGINTAQHCADLCYAGFVNLTCNSFYFCAKERECLFSGENVPSPVGPKPDIVTGCEAYSRTVTARDPAPPTTSEALTLIKNNIYRGQLKITIPGPGYKEPYTYPATMVKTDIMEPGTQTKQNQVMQHFASFKNNSKTKDFDSSLKQLSLDECAVACTSTLDIQCRGFTYCDGVFICTLTKMRPDQMPSTGLQQADGCYMYQRNYLDDYISTPGSVSMTTAEATVSSVSSSDCAKQCTQAKSPACKSFEFCSSTKQCQLFSGRSVGNATSGVSTTCELFKRSYLGDFQPVNSGTYIFTSVVQFLRISVSQCAEMCIEEQGSHCHGFYFCNTVSACYLTSLQSGQSSQVQTDHSSHAFFCNYYTREVNITVSSTVISTTSQTNKISSGQSSIRNTLKGSTSPHGTGKMSSSKSSSSVSTKDTVTSSNKFSHSIPPCIGVTQQQTSDDSKVKTGTVLGVAFATFIIGLIIGAAAFYVFIKFRSKPREEIEMHLTGSDRS